MIRFPAPLRPGDRIGVTSPSSGVAGAGTRRIDFCVDWLRRRGYDVASARSSHPGVARPRSTSLTISTGTPSPQPSRPGWSAGPTCRR